MNSPIGNRNERKRDRPGDEQVESNFDWPSQLPESSLSAGLDPPTGSKTWKEYLIAEGLVSEESLHRSKRPFPMKSARAHKYCKNLRNNLKHFEECVVDGFDLNAITKVAVKVPPREAKIKDFEVNNDSKLKLLSGKNCFIRDGTKEG